MKNDIRILADASFAPGGDRSRTGVVIKVLDATVHWCSTKQSLASTSAHEAELNGLTTGTQLGINIRKHSPRAPGNNPENEPGPG